MSSIDWIILGLVLAFIVLYGLAKTRNQSGVSDFVTGGNKASWWTIGLSVMATQASAITFLSTPGQAFHDGMGFVQFYFGLPIAMVIISLFFVPIYHRLKVFTAYAYLEDRFNVQTRTLTAVFFLIQRGLAAGITIFAPSIILGMIPRAHRCIFVLNELPDLQARIQVALFGILQEKEIQIRGFKLRLPIEAQFVFTANPEDYTNRGSIVTPLKDRIGSQILTHYPHSLTVAKAITRQEVKPREADQNMHIPELARDLLEQIGFEARRSEYVDAKSGVSARMSITAFENLISTAERRMLINAQDKTTLRMSDFLGIIAAINGKVELVYEGEQEGAEQISLHLINQAVKTLFPKYFPEIKKLQKQDQEGPYDSLLGWFYSDNDLFIEDGLPEDVYQDTLRSVPHLEDLVDEFQRDCASADKYFLMEFLLWGLEAHKKLNKYRTLEGFQFKDGLGNLFAEL